LAELKRQISNPTSDIRAFLTADVLAFVRRLLDRALKEGGEVYLALYELHDPELIALLKSAVGSGRVHLLLSTAGSQDPNPKATPKDERQPVVWDVENNDARLSIRGSAPKSIQDRMFNNKTPIGHEKFAVYVKNNVPTMVMTGSTNWTETGLCTQSNNVIIIENAEVAKFYFDFCHRLVADPQPKRVPLISALRHLGYRGPRSSVAGRWRSASRADHSNSGCDYFRPTLSRIDAGSKAPRNAYQIFRTASRVSPAGIDGFPGCPRALGRPSVRPSAHVIGSLRAMSDLVVLDFNGVGTADEVLTKLRGMQKEYLIDLEDACVVVHTDTGKVQVKQAVNLTSVGAASGASTGMLIGALAGLLILNPLAGMAVGGLAGAGFGALSGSMADFGINDEFIKNLGKTIPKGSSALFLLIKRSTPDKVLPELEPYRPRVLKTSLSKEQEDKLRTALSAAANA
jgi:uncharacterized membrane protein